MASRKEQKEQARQARLAAEAEHAARAARNRRMSIFGGAIAVAVAVIVAAIVISSTGGGNTNTTGPVSPTSTTATKTYATVNKLLQGIPQNGTILGDPSAKVTMTYFGDLECPICRDFTMNVFPQFVQDQVRTGKVKVQYKSSCTATCNNTTWGSQNAAYAHFGIQQVAAYAAGKQSRFWDYAELFYHEQGKENTGYMTESYLLGIAKQIPGFNITKWQTDRKDPALLSQVSAEEALSQKQAPNGTPTLIVKGPKGEERVPGTCNVGNGVEGFPCYPALASAVKTVS